MDLTNISYQMFFFVCFYGFAQTFGVYFSAQNVQPFSTHLRHCKQQILYYHYMTMHYNDDCIVITGMVVVGFAVFSNELKEIRQ